MLLCVVRRLSCDVLSIAELLHCDNINIVGNITMNSMNGEFLCDSLSYCRLTSCKFIPPLPERLLFFNMQVLESR